MRTKNIKYYDEIKFFILSFLLVFSILTYHYDSVFLQLPQIKEFNIEQLGSFKVSFYAGLYSGAIYSIFTGFVVAGVLYWFQKTDLKSELKEQTLTEISAVQEQLKFALEQPKVFQFGDFIYYYPGIHEAHELLVRQPLSVWNKRIQGNKVLDAITDFQRCFLEFRTVARHLSTYLQKHIRHSLASSGVDSCHDDTVLRYCHAKLLDFGDSYIFKELSESPTNIWIGKAFLYVSSQDDYPGIIKKYFEKRDILELSYEKLKEMTHANL